MKRVIKVIGLGASLALLPAAAFAVNVSSSDGSGLQWRVASYSTGAKVDGNLGSTNGNAVYYAGKVVWYQWYCSNTDIGRYTGNTTSTNGNVTRGGYITYSARGSCSAHRVQSEVCRDIQLIPDPCGSWSREY